MSILMKASHEWATRPNDERFLSLTAMQQHFQNVRDHSKELVVATRKLQFEPDSDNKGLLLTGPNGHAYAPTNWSFGQLAQLSEAPARYLRTLPAPLAADCLNFGIKFKRDIEDVGILLDKTGEPIIRAATGPKYGRIWNTNILDALVNRFGDGVNGDWRVPGEFGQKVVVDKQNTTLYASDRDMFVFLADEDHKITIPNRRDGKSGEMSRGFFIWNSEVGSSTFGLATFLFDYVCKNRIVWGAEQYKEIKMRHTVSAPDRFIDELRPALIEYANSATTSIVDGIKLAQEARMGDELDDFLAKRFGKRPAVAMKAIHMEEEGRPIETRFDVVTAATAYARGIEFQDERVALERSAGELLDF